MNQLIIAFYPELSKSLDIHKYFLGDVWEVGFILRYFF